jgi:hypothetical protein
LGWTISASSFHLYFIWLSSLYKWKKGQLK